MTVRFEFTEVLSSSLLSLLHNCAGQVSLISTKNCYACFNEDTIAVMLSLRAVTGFKLLAVNCRGLYKQ